MKAKGWCRDSSIAESRHGCFSQLMSIRDCYVHQQQCGRGLCPHVGGGTRGIRSRPVRMVHISLWAENQKFTFKLKRVFLLVETFFLNQGTLEDSYTVINEYNVKKICPWFRIKTLKIGINWRFVKTSKAFKLYEQYFIVAIKLPYWIHSQVGKNKNYLKIRGKCIN